MTRTRRPWLPAWLRRTPAAPFRRPAPRRLGVECLEDRVVPTQFLDVGGLRFLTPTQFASGQGGTFTLSGRSNDSVSIGFTPEQGGAFNPLLQIQLGEDPDDGFVLPGSFVLDRGAETFTTAGMLTMNLVAVPSGPPIPIFSQTQSTATDPITQDFGIPALLGFGVTITATNAQPSAFPVLDWVNLQMTGLVLSADDSGGKVGIQGTGKINSAAGADLSKIGFVKDLVVKVDGTNYVYASKGGITLTGLEGQLDFSTNGYEVGGYTVTGEVDVGYSNANGNQRISIGGGAALTAPADEGFKLENVSGKIEVSLGSEDGVPKFYGLTLEVDGSFTAGGLSLKTVDGFGFSYNFDGPQWEVFGGVDFVIKDKAEVVVLLGTQTAPGLVIKDGKLSTFSGTINADFTLGPVVISSSPSNGLTFAYDRDKGQFEMSGGLGIKVGTGSKQFTLDATLGDATDPGIIYDTGKGGLQQANFGVTGQLSVGSLSFTAQDAGFRWVKATDTTPESWEIHGGFGIDFKAFQAAVTLGTTANPGIVVDGDGFRLDGITVEVENVTLGPLQLEDLKVGYKKDGDSYDVDVAVTVGIGSFVVGGEFVVIDGRLDSIEASFLNPEGVPIGETGVELVSVDITVKNIETPSQIAVVGKVGVVYGETVTMLGKSVNVFYAEGDLTVDANEFVLDATAQLGAYSDDGGRTWQGVLGSGDARLNLNWQTQIYSLHVEVDGLLGVFDIEGDIVFAPGKDIQLLAEADVVIPSWVPFIGGDKLGGFGFYFEHVFPHDGVPTSTTFAAWIDIEVIWTITVGFEVVIDANGNANWGLIGADQVTGFKQSVANPGPRTFTYTTDLAGLTPAGATTLLAQVDWSRGSPAAPLDGPPKLQVRRTLNGTTTTIDEKDFAANGITVIGDGRLTGSKSVTLQIADPAATGPYQPLAGDYAILVEATADANPFPNFPSQTAADRLTVTVTGHLPQPIFGPVGGTAPVAPAVPPAPADTFPVTITGNADDDFVAGTKVSLYRVSSADPFRRPVLVQTVAATPTGGSGFSAAFRVPVDGLSAVPYTLFAVVDDGHSPPVSSAPSAPFTPAFAVRGTVTNQNGTPVTAVPVFLDYNGNLIQDANEPGQTTGPGGYAFTAAFAPATGWDPVPQNAPFQVVLPTLSNRVLDGGFEAPSVQTEPGSYKYLPTGSAWTFFDDSGLASNGSGFDNAGAPAGDQVAFLQGTGHIRQTVSLAAGTYRIGFQSAQRPTNLQTFQVRVTDATGASVLVNRFQPAGAGFQAYATDGFYVPAGRYTVAFVGTNENAAVNGGDNTAFLDAVGVLPTTAGGQFDPLTTATVTYDGTTGVVASYALRAKTAITGVVYDDSDGNGNPAAGRPVAGAVAYLDTNNNGVRDAGEPTAVTDAGGGYAFTDLTAGAYTVRVDLATVGRGTAAPAFAVPAGTAGTDAGPNAGQYTYGLSFTAERPVVVTSLGVFDDNGDGLTTTLTAVLYDADTRVELARLTFTPQNPGTLAGGTRYLDLPAPITLRPGFNGMIAAYGFGAADRPGVAAYLPAGTTVPWAADGGGGRLSFGTLAPDPLNPLVGRVRVGGSTAAAPNAYPTIPDYTGYFTGNVTPFAAGSFLYRDIPWAPSPQSPAEYAVTLDDSGYDLAEGKDLGLLPPTVFFGTVTGDPLVNGQPQASAPQAGWAVGLLADRVVLAINAGGADGPGFVPDVNFDAGQAAQTTAQVDTSRVANAPAEAAYQTGRVGVNGGGFDYVIPGLSPGASYTVRLHFAEIVHQVAGQRKFNAAINGTQVLFDFDIVAAAGSPNTAYARDFAATADSFGRIALAFSAGSADVPLVNLIQLLSPAGGATAPAKLAIDAGGGGTGNFIADQYVTGGTTAAWWGEVVVGTAFNPAPEPVYHTLRGGDQFTYDLPGFGPGRPYSVRLHFADFGVTGPGQRKFNVDINGRRALTDFDPAAAAGQPWEIGYAYATYLDAVADANGHLVIAFSKGSANVPIVSGIEVFEPSTVVATTTTDAQGNYALVGYGAGGYTVAESPPAGWQQLAPEVTTPTFAPTTVPVQYYSPTPGKEVRQLATADFNGDGRLDVVVSTWLPRAGGGYAEVYVLYNRPDGSFAQDPTGGTFGTEYEFELPAPPVVVVGDFNGDHRPDVAIIGNGDFGGEPPSNAFFLASGGSDPDFPLGGDIPAWALPTLAAGESFTAAAAADVNGDGLDDLVIGTSLGYGQSARMVYAENAAGGTPSVTSSTLPNAQGAPSYYDTHLYAVRGLSVVDVDGDGDRDVVMLAVVFTNAGAPIIYGQGHPVLSVAYRDGAGWHGPVTGNLPQNIQGVTGMAVVPPRPGQPPTLIATTPIYTTDFTNKYDYNFASYHVIHAWANGGLSQAEVDLPDQGQPRATAPNLRILSAPRLADVNGDGLPDLIGLFAPTMASQAISIRINNGGYGAGMFDWADPILLPLPANLTDWVGDFEVGDFDGDGQADVLVPVAGQPGMLFRNVTPPGRPGRTVYAAAGDSVAGLDFHSAQEPAKSAVRGRVFEDVIRNGTRDAGDTPTAGAVVFADLNRNGRLDPGEPRATTTAGGHYILPGLADGTYSVGVLPDAGWASVTGDFHDVTIAGGSVERADLGRVRRLLGAVDPQAVRAGGTVDVAVPVTDAAAGRRLVYTAEGHVPAGLSVDPATGRVTWTPAAGQRGTHTVTVRVRDPFDPLFTETTPVTIRVDRTTDPRVAAGTDAGGSPQVRAYDAAGNPVLDVTPFGRDFRGGVRVATGDLTGDRVDDVIAAAGPGGGPRVVVYDGATGAEVASLFAFEPEFTGGLEVAAGDVNGDGYADLVVAAGPGGGPRVRVLSGRDWSVLADFFAFDPAFRGGARVAAGDVNGDGYADVVVAAGPGGGPHVRVFDGETWGELASYFASEVAVPGGLSVAAGDLDGDGRSDLVVGAGAGGGPRVLAFAAPEVLAGRAGPANRLADFFAADPADRGGVRVAVKPMDGASPEAVVVAAAGRATAFALPGRSGGAPVDLFALDPFPGFAGGVFVG